MALELRIIVEIIDTEPDVASHEGVATRARRTVPLVSEVPDTAGICAIAGAVVERHVNEVRDEVRESLDVIAKQPGMP